MSIEKKVIYSDQMQVSLEECIDFLVDVLKVSVDIAIETNKRILDAADSLAYYSSKGQIEPYLKDKKREYRRLIEGHYKIIYRIENDSVYIVDIFDSRQDPNKMRG